MSKEYQDYRNTRDLTNNHTNYTYFINEDGELVMQNPRYERYALFIKCSLKAKLNSNHKHGVKLY